MDRFGKKTHRQIALGIDREQPVDNAYPAFDETGDHRGAFGADLLAGDHQVEHRIVDERVKRLLKPRVCLREACEARQFLLRGAEPRFDRQVQFTQSAVELLLDP